MSEPSTALPVHYELTRRQMLFSSCSIATAFALLGWLGQRIITRVDLVHWWAPFASGGGVMAADFVSGMVHWFADTWGRDDCPLIGPRLLVPFRVHHINPDDFLRRRFVDTNGEVAALAIPLLAALLAVPLDSPWGAIVAVFGLAFCAVGSLTNQIHQWAHTAAPPRLIAAFQRWGIILGREHSEHHARPYDRRYCITTGWCNRPLDAIDFFRFLERTITRVTGVQPRYDDRRYEARYGVAPLCRE